MEFTLKTFLTALGFYVLSVALCLACLLVGAFVLMTYAAAWHGHNGNVPAIGYVDALYSACLLILVGLSVRGPRKRS